MKLVWLVFVLIFNSLQAQKDSLKVNEIEKVIVIARDPISEKFSVKKIGKMQIYLNPAANADPLKAIATMPASTNIDETANPSLRGASADRSRVYLNGSPILNPVRFSRNDGLGNFSLFNTEIIQKQYVYASNPPLIFGNSSGGLVEIQTNNKLNKDAYQFSIGLLNAGAMANKKWSENSFTQIYSNYQFGEGFIALNRKNLEQLRYFKTFDLGINTHIHIDKNLIFNTFNYFIDEKYNFLNRQLKFEENTDYLGKRFFSVNNLDYYSGKSKIRWTSMFDYSHSQIYFGNLDTKMTNFQQFNSLNIRTLFSTKFHLQYGVDASVFETKYKGKVPQYFYALSSQSPYFEIDRNEIFHFVEPFLYANYNISSKFGISSAIRKNILIHRKSESFMSYQFSANYRINSEHQFIFGMGKYHSYSSSNHLSQEYKTLKSNQIAIDYSYENSDFQLSSALFYKKDLGDFITSDFAKISDTETFGAEISLSGNLTRNLSFSISNTFIDQKYYIDNQKYTSPFDLKYFIKSHLMYKTPKLLSLSLVFSARSSSRYTPIDGAVFEPLAMDFSPNFGKWYDAKLLPYKRLDLMASKTFVFKKYALTAVLSLNNVMNWENPASVYYNANYSERFFNYFQKRTLYAGAIFYL